MSQSIAVLSIVRAYITFRMGERWGVYSVLVGKPGEKRPLGRPRRRWEDNIKINIQEVGCGCKLWAVGPQLATSQQLKVHATHTKNC
jgi:hypothetical protein